MQEYKVLVLIPARFESSRFPGKPLAPLKGKSMISRVLQNAQSISDSSIQIKAVVLTDDSRIEDHIKDMGGEVRRVDDDTVSGTDRIYLGYQRFFKEENWDLIINVQGDEPLLPGSEILELAKFHLERDFDICTMLRRESSFEHFADPNKVKTIFSEKTGECHYFSRAPIPYSRDNSGEKFEGHWFFQAGVYSFLPKALVAFCQSKASYYEEIEKLEQLRALEMGMRIGAYETKTELFGVDTPEDVAVVEGVLD
ncbi:MAG: 3-deoxy-manno-octulosonate cytidylyltransferase [Halobacteriovoraceae bacterium]|jgi:3-deoxy-manno-octulosonate cytidylyltransferase (CMP-KDO synthetase)|nr:3-deoxy-manno-octulosonate cytidylyltransferase [Halobacteriovoraceae bacterium]MBT5093832.1 3-deoxy-manno-octulosonate cytidylyltransferase [Halobacteriovoraceae bacterium]